MIEVTSLTKQYRSVRAVDDLTFQVAPGKVTGFLGPNGAGKSTTMRIIMGLDRPSAGRALIDGRPYTSFPEPLRQVGALLDAEAMHPGRTGIGHLRIAAKTNGIPASRVSAVIEQVGLGTAARRRIKGYSLGMRQRLGIAAALLGDPPVLMFDEPVNGLDVDGVRWIRGLLRKFADEGRTVFVSSHLMSELQLIADHIIIIGKGHLVADASLPELLHSLGPQRVQVRTSQATALAPALERHGARIASVDGEVLEVEGLGAAEVGMIARSADVPVGSLTEVEQSLEEAYLRLTDDLAQHASVPGPTKEIS